MKAYEFIIPRHLDGPLFRDNLARVAGGFTAWDAEGSWVDGNATVEELVRVFRVALTWRQILQGRESRLFRFAFAHARLHGEMAFYYGPPGRPAIYRTGN